MFLLQSLIYLSCSSDARLGSPALPSSSGKMARRTLMSCIIIQSVNFQYYEYCDRLQFSSEGAYSEISHFVNFAAPHISMIQS